ncbi:MAG: chemotaxis protein CheW [Gemmatimonadaceae bacterium]
MSLLDHPSSLLRVRLGGATVGLPALAVREIVRAVAITPVPGAPAIVEGAVSFRGLLVPVVDVRQRLALPPKALDADEFLVLLQAGARTIAMRVDDVDDLVETDGSAVSDSESLSPALRGLAGLTALADGVLVIYDPAGFISAAEIDALDTALAARA